MSSPTPALRVGWTPSQVVRDAGPVPLCGWLVNIVRIPSAGQLGNSSPERVCGEAAGLASRLWEQLQEAPPPGMWLGCFTSHTPLTAQSFPSKDPELEFLSLSPGLCQRSPSDLRADTLQHRPVYGVKC